MMPGVPSSTMRPSPMSSAPSAHPVLTEVSTMLTPIERLRVDAAGEGLYHALHRDSVEDIIRDLKERGAAVVLMSVSRCSREQATSRVANMVREFPRVPAVAILTEVGPQTPQ